MLQNLTYSPSEAYHDIQSVGVALNSSSDPSVPVVLVAGPVVIGVVTAAAVEFCSAVSVDILIATSH